MNKTKEIPNMRIEHKNFILEIEEITDYDSGKRTHYKVSCNELPYFPQGLYKSDLETIITRFKLAVKSQMKADEVEKEEKEIPLFMQQNKPKEEAKYERIGEQSLIKRLKSIPSSLSAEELDERLLQIHNLFKEVLNYNLAHLKTKYFELIENRE